MTVRRVMGIETEYGVLRPGDQRTTPMVLSGLVVRAYANDVGLNAAQSRWDYSDESPLRDQRGYDIAREVAEELLANADVAPVGLGARDSLLHCGGRHQECLSNLLHGEPRHDSKCEGDLLR